MIWIFNMHTFNFRFRFVSSDEMGWKKLWNDHIKSFSFPKTRETVADNTSVFDTGAMLDEILSCLLMMAFNYYNCDEYRLLLMAICVFIEYYY